MSSSRSLASARTKRASGNSTIPGATELVEQSSQSKMQQPIVKLSLPQAINRINERLNTLELFAEATTTVVDEIQNFHTNTSDKYIVDRDVFTSLVSRIETLERTNSVSLESGGSNTLPTNPTKPTASNVTNDIEEIRKHLIRLQTYTMETNANLQDMLFSKNGTSVVNFNDIFSDPNSTPPTPPILAQNTTKVSQNTDPSPVLNESTNTPDNNELDVEDELDNDDGWTLKSDETLMSDGDLIKSADNAL